MKIRITPTRFNQLPITDPAYQYPPSRNPYWTKLREQPSIKDRAYCDNETETHAGNWRQRFQSPVPMNKAKLHVEVGTNAGHVILEWAARSPKDAFIGLDWKFKVIHRAAEKALDRQLDNVLFFRAHAERISRMFGPDEVDSLSIFFPDPWPKKSDWKNRYINAVRLREIHALLKPSGLLHIKTDHPGYFEWMENAVNETRNLWVVEERTDDLHGKHPDPDSLKIPEITLFEGLFIRDGIKINSLKLRKKT